VTLLREPVETGIRHASELRHLVDGVGTSAGVSQQSEAIDAAY
jgi:hypothetical protein